MTEATSPTLGLTPKNGEPVSAGPDVFPMVRIGMSVGGLEVASPLLTGTTIQASGQEDRGLGCMTSMPTLCGQKILLIEDEWLIADFISAMLEDMECTVSGPVATVVDALTAIAAGNIDCALLDANLNGECSAPIADALVAKGIPFIVVTGYGGLVLATETMNIAPRLGKPFLEADLRRSLELALNKPVLI